MTFKRSLLLVLLLAALLSADDSFAEKDSKVVFVGKSTSASAKLALKGKSLSMKLKALGSQKLRENTMTFDLGGCVIKASLGSSYGKPQLRFKDEPATSVRLFPISAQLSASDFKASGYADKLPKFSHSCVPKFKTDGELQVVKVSMTLDAEADFFSIEFNDATLYKGQYSTGSIVLIAAGSVDGILLLAGGIVGLIVYFIRQKRSKGKKGPIAKVSTKDGKQTPAPIKPSHTAIQIDSPAPKKKSPPAKNSKSKAASAEQAQKKDATRQKTATSEASLSISQSESSFKL